MMIDFDSLATQCMEGVDRNIIHSIVKVESGFNPYAIGMVGGRLARQPENQQEATATAKSLDAFGYNYSMGLGQINKMHLKRFGLDHESIFEPCANLQAGATIFKECQTRAGKNFGDEESALKAALSCYYSGNFTRGQQKEGAAPGYVDKVLKQHAGNKKEGIAAAIPVLSTKPATGVATASEKQEEQKVKQSWDVFNDF